MAKSTRRSIAACNAHEARVRSPTAAFEVLVPPDLLRAGSGTPRIMLSILMHPWAGNVSVLDELGVVQLPWTCLTTLEGQLRTFLVLIVRSKIIRVLKIDN